MCKNCWGMPTSRPRRSTPRSRTSTCGRFTKRRTLAPADHRHIPVTRRPLSWAALLPFTLAALVSACDDDGTKPEPTATAVAQSTTVAPTPNVEQSADLASSIGPRADLPPNDPIALAARYGVT